MQGPLKIKRKRNEEPLDTFGRQFVVLIVFILKASISNRRPATDQETSH